MIPRDRQLASQLRAKLIDFDRDQLGLPGIRPAGYLDCLVAQMVDSVRRIKYVEVIRNKPLSGIYADPNNPFFDGVKGAAWQMQQGHLEEAFWLTFLLTHFGKNKSSGWVLMREVYKGSSTSGPWTWDNIAHHFDEFRRWLQGNQDRLKGLGKFGNHRKYESLDAYSPNGTGVAIGSYIEWIESKGDHQGLVADALQENGNDGKAAFHTLYHSMSSVMRFGRMGRFDYLTMVGKLGLAPIKPDSTYMREATGPKTGAQLLFLGNSQTGMPIHQLESDVNLLESDLGLPFGMQILEDSLCNWQKSPHQYRYFNG